MMGSVLRLVEFALMVHGYSVNHGQLFGPHPVLLTMAHSACRGFCDLDTQEEEVSAIPSRFGGRGSQYELGAVIW